MPIPNGALPQTQAAYANLTAALTQRGIGSRLAQFGGTRTESDTTRILGYRLADYNHDHGLPLETPHDETILDAFRPIAPYGLSYHNYGAAFDLILGHADPTAPPLPLPPGLSTAQAYEIAGSLAPQFGLRWGGHFADVDVRHFELDMSLADARNAYAAFTGGAQLPPMTSAFDLSAFLPELAPTPQPLPDLSDLPPIETIGDYGLGDDSGEASGFLDLMSGLPQADQVLYRQVGLFALVGVGIGVVVWALRRRLSPRLA